MKWILFYVLLLEFSWANAEVTWPNGTYGLPKAKSGCPQSEGITWSDGWRVQDMSHNKRSGSNISPDSHLDAVIFKDKRFLNRTFCVKSRFGTSKKEWPKGFYCVYKNSGSSCPTGMAIGWTKWFDRKYLNINRKGGTLPDGEYNRDTLLKYCCQDQGHWYNSIELPVDRPFYLLPHHSSASDSSKCQRVKYALSSLEYIIYNNQNVTQDPDNNHAYTELTDSRLSKLYYCYYKGCNDKVTGRKGSFASPKFLPGHYPSFQYCSWLVTVSESLVVSLDFTHLSVPDCEENFVKIYDGVNDVAPILATYCGLNASSRRTVMSTSNNVFVVLKSGNNSKSPDTLLRFQAEYTTLVKEAEQTRTRNTVNTSYTTNVPPHAKSINQNSKSFPVSSIITAVIAGVTITVLIVIIVVLYNRRKTRQREISPTFLRGLNPSYDRKLNTENCQTDLEGYTMATSPEEKLWLASSKICKESRNPIYQSGDDDATSNVYCSADNITYKPAIPITGDVNNPLYDTPDVRMSSVYTDPTTSMSDAHYNLST